MKTTLIAISTAAIMGLGAPALAQVAPDQEAVDGHNMMIGHAYTLLAQEGLSTEGLQDLSLDQLTEVIAVIEGSRGEDPGVIRQRVEQAKERE